MRQCIFFKSKIQMDVGRELEHNKNEFTLNLKTFLRVAFSMILFIFFITGNLVTGHLNT
jgi:hypothetical protein